MYSAAGLVRIGEQKYIPRSETEPQVATEIHELISFLEFHVVDDDYFVQ